MENGRKCSSLHAHQLISIRWHGGAQSNTVDSILSHRQQDLAIDIAQASITITGHVTIEPNFLDVAITKETVILVKATE